MFQDFYVIVQWSIFRRWEVINAGYDEKGKRTLRNIYRVLCARYPNNSYQLIHFGSANIVERRVVHTDALMQERIEESHAES